MRPAASSSRSSPRRPGPRRPRSAPRSRRAPPPPRSPPAGRLSRRGSGRRRTALGCSSQAAAAISTLSGSLRSRPAANAWRKAASEKAAARPICGREGRRSHREQRVPRPRVGPAHRRQPALARAPLDLRHARLTLFGLGPGAPVELEQPAEQDRLPDRRLGQHFMDALGSEVRVRRTEVEIKNGPPGNARRGSPIHRRRGSPPSPPRRRSGGDGSCARPPRSRPRAASRPRARRSARSPSRRRCGRRAARRTCVADDLDHAAAVTVYRRRADAPEREAADHDVVAALVRLRLGEPEARHLRMAERGAGDVVVGERVDPACRRRPRRRSRPRRTPCGPAPGRGPGRRSRRRPRLTSSCARPPRSAVLADLDPCLVEAEALRCRARGRPRCTGSRRSRSRRRRKFDPFCRRLDLLDPVLVITVTFCFLSSR